MRLPLVSIASLIAVPLLAAPPLLQPGDVLLVCYSSVICIFEPPVPVWSVSVIPRGSSVSTFSYAFTWRSDASRAGGIAYSDLAGVIVSSDPASARESFLSVLHDDGSATTFGGGVPVENGMILGIAPTSRDVLVLALVPLTHYTSQGELWRLSPGGELIARMRLPTTDSSSLDVASDQCTVFYGTGTAIARYDACRQIELADFAGTDDRVTNVRIAPDGEVFGIDSATNQLLRFSTDGRLADAFSLPLIAAENESITAFAFDETGENVWVATSFRCLATSGRLMLVERTTGRVLRTIQPETASPKNWFFALATVSEWRAALSRPSSRRHAAGH